MTRQNTFVEPGDTFDSFLLFIYGSHIATLYRDGKVMINRRGSDSNTTRNRLNDVLMPLGWKIDREADRSWVIRTLMRPYKSMEYIDGLVLSAVANHERADNA